MSSSGEAQKKMNDVIDEFLKALVLAGVTLEKTCISVDDLGCPHEPNPLPAGKMAIYTFQRDGRYLKIGKVGPKSNARFRNQHYGPHRAKSNLAKSLLDDPDFAMCSLSENNIDAWIRNNIRRIDILIDQQVGIFVLNFLEAFLQCRFRPKYEGFESQK
jgi:hypothetical protein